MADQRVVITLNVNSRGSAQVTALQKQLAALDRQENKLAKTTRMADEYFFRLAKKTDLVSRSFQKMRSIVGTMVGIFSKFNAVLSVVATVTLPLLNAAFSAGRLVAKAYQITLQLVAVGVAAVGSAVAVGLAAFKEYNAAMQSFAYSSTKSLNPTQRASGAIRNLQRDAQLAVFGLMGLNDAFVQVNQSSTFTGESQKMLRALADFAAAGGDPAKNIAAAGAFIGLLQKEGKLTQEVLEAGQKIGPQFAKALSEAKKKGMSSAEDLKRMLYSGDMAMLGGVAGQAGRLSDTLVGQFKRIFNEAFVIGTDLGDAMLSPAKKALGEIGQSMLRTLRRVAPAFANFGKGTFLDSLVSGFIKLEDALVNLFRKWLPASTGMLKNFVNWWEKVVFVFKNLRERMQPLLDAGRAIMDVFGPAFTQIFSRFGDKYGEIGLLIQDNREEFDRLGVNLERFVNLFFDFGTVLETAFAKALPIINSVAEAFMTIAETLLAIIRGIATLGSGGLGGFGAGAGGMAALYAMFAGKRLIMGTKGPDGRRQRGVGGMTPGSINSRLGVFGVLGGGFMPGLNRYGDGQRLRGGIGAVGRGLGMVAERTGLAQSMHYGSQFVRNLGGNWNQPYSPYQNKYMRQNRGGGGAPGGKGGYIDPMRRYIAHNEAMSRGSTFAKYKAFRGGITGTQNNPRMASLRKAGALSYKQGRFTRGYAPTGMGAGIAAMLASQFAMGKMDFADTGLGNAGRTISSLGSTMAMFNPLAGLGMTLAGGALGAKTPGGGALAGAGAGAAFGTMVGGPVGAAVGALLGAAVGGISGAINRFKGEDKKLKDAAQKKGLEVFGKIAKEFISSGDFSLAKKEADKLRQEADRIRSLGLEGMDRTARKVRLAELKTSGKITSEQFELLSNGVTAYVDGLDQQAKSVERVNNIIDLGFNQKMSKMIKITGKSQEEIMGLANEIGVNLFDATLSTTDALQKMGFAMKVTAEQIRGSIIDIQQDALNPLRAELQKLEAAEQIETLLQGFADMGSAAGNDDLKRFGLDLVDLLNLQFPEDPYGNLFRAQEIIEKESAPGGRLADVSELLVASLMGSINTAIADQRGGVSASLATDIARGFAEEGKLVDQADLKKVIANMSPAEVAQLTASVASGDIYGATKLLNTYGPIGGPTFSEGELTGPFAGIKWEEITKGIGEGFLATLTDQERTMYEGTMEAIRAGFSDAPKWWDTPPKWWPELSDTSTPRAKTVGDTATSKLASTMNKHRMIDSSIPGKRKVTSSLRNYNLGSINSDHVTGNAYDLTGQNLGEYAYTVKANGGLAEFHGWGSSRHLHVVPGMDPLGRWFEDYRWGQELAGKTGDSPTPVVPKAMPTASFSGGTYNYSVIVNGANADPNQIADAVINRIQRLERDKKERR